MKKKLPTKRYQTGGPIKPNIQRLGNIEFDSNTARKGQYGNLIVTDIKTGKEFGVVRKKDGTYRWFKPGYDIRHENSYLQDNVTVSIPWWQKTAAKMTSYSDAAQLGDKVLDRLSFYSKHRPGGKMTEAERKYRQGISDRISTYYYDPRDVAKELRSPADNAPGTFDKKYLNFYLGLPQADSSFTQSQYLPNDAVSGAIYYTPKDRESLKRNALAAYFGRFSGSHGVGRSGHNVTVRMKGGEEDLGDFTIGSGIDDRGEYISVYDRWDINPMGPEAAGYAGQGNQKSYYAPQSWAPDIDRLNNPFRVYDRFYLDELDKETADRVRKEHQRSGITPMDRRTVSQDYQSEQNPPSMKKGKRNSYNTGGTYQPVGYPVDPAQIRKQKADELAAQGNFWTGLGQFATSYALPLAAGPLAPAIGTAIDKILPAQKHNTGGPVMPTDSVPYRPTITNPLTTMVTPTITGVNPMGYEHNLQNSLAPMQVSGNNRLTVGYPGPVAPHIYANMKKGSSGHVKSKDRYREKQFGGSFQTGGDIQLNSNSFQVQGKAQQTDGNKYATPNGDVMLDHNEVVTGSFVFSDSLTNPLTGNKYSADAKVIEKSKGKAESKVAKFKDLISQKTLKFAQMMSEDLKQNQELVATAQGHRNVDGSTKQRYAYGGPTDPILAAFLQFRKTHTGPIPPIAGPNQTVMPDGSIVPNPPPVPVVPFSTEDRFSHVESTPYLVDDAIDAYNKPWKTDAGRQMGLTTGPSIQAPADPASYKVPFTGGDALQAISVGSKFFQALSPVEVEPTRSNTAPINQEVYDPRASLYQNQRNYRNALNSLQAGSINTRRAVGQQLNAQRINADSQVLDRYNQMNKQARTQFEERLAARQRENIGYANYAADLNARNRAARANNLDTAFNSLGYFGQGLNQKRQAADALKLYKDIFPSVSQRILDSLFQGQR